MQTETRELKERILERLIEHPQVADHFVRLQMTTDSLRSRFARVADQIGWEFSRQLFGGLTTEQWRELEEDPSLATANPESLQRDLQQWVQELDRRIQAKKPVISTWDPFSFLKKMGPAELRTFLDPIPEEELALISAFWSAADLEQYLLIHQSPMRKRRIIFHISRAEKLPIQAVQETSLKLADRLQRRCPPRFPIEAVQARKAEEERAKLAFEALRREQARQAEEAASQRRIPIQARLNEIQRELQLEEENQEALLNFLNKERARTIG